MEESFARVLAAKRAEVLTELESLRTELAQTTEKIQTREAQLKNIEGLLSLEGTESSEGQRERPDSRVAERSQSMLRGASFLAAAAELLERSGQPMHYTKLADSLARENVYVPGRNPAANLVTHLSRDSRFRRVGRGTYGLQQWARQKGN